MPKASSTLVAVASGTSKHLRMPCEEGCRTAVFGKTERTVGWEGNGEPIMVGLLRHCDEGNLQSTARPALTSLSHSFTLDFVIGFERRDDAERVMTVLEKRMERYGLTLHPDKTQLIAFTRPPASQRSGKGPSTFDFLGFTFYWRRTRRGRWAMGCKTRHARLRRAMQSVAEWCRRHRHLPVAVQHAALNRRLVGHFNYFGVNGNYGRLACLVRVTWQLWLKWLRRRSQRTRLTVTRYEQLLVRFPLPRPRITVRIWD